jgi:hypothetical protein
MFGGIFVPMPAYRPSHTIDLSLSNCIIDTEIQLSQQHQFMVEIKTFELSTVQFIFDVHTSTVHCDTVAFPVHFTSDGFANYIDCDDNAIASIDDNLFCSEIIDNASIEWSLLYATLHTDVFGRCEHDHDYARRLPIGMLHRYLHRECVDAVAIFNNLRGTTDNVLIVDDDDDQVDKVHNIGALSTTATVGNVVSIGRRGGTMVVAFEVG